MSLQTLFASAVLGYDGGPAVKENPEQERTKKLMEAEAQSFNSGVGKTGAMETGPQSAKKQTGLDTSQPGKSTKDEGLSIEICILAENIAHDLRNQLEGLYAQMEAEHKAMDENERMIDADSKLVSVGQEKLGLAQVKGEFELSDGGTMLADDDLEFLLQRYEERCGDVDRTSYEDIKDAIGSEIIFIEEGIEERKKQNVYHEKQLRIISEEIDVISEEQIPVIEELSARASDPNEDPVALAKDFAELTEDEQILAIAQSDNENLMSESLSLTSEDQAKTEIVSMGF